MKKKWFFLAGSIALALAFGAVGCGESANLPGDQSGTQNNTQPSEQGGTEQGGTQNNTQPSEQGGTEQGGTEQGGQTAPEGEVVGTYTGMEDAKTVYAVGAVTTAKLLSFSLASGNASLAATVAEEDNSGFGLPDLVEDLTKVQEGAADFNKYFNMLDSFLNKQALTTVVTENTQGGDLAQYDYKAVITGKNAANEDVVHTLYFDARLINDTSNKTKTEKVYALSGAVEMEEGTFYYMSGTHILRSETEDGETEKSEELKIRASVAQNAMRQYVELKYENESEEEWGEVEQEAEYTYTIYSEDGIVERTTVEFEQDNEHGQTETEYKIVFQKGRSRSSYEVERVTANGQTYIEVEYNIDGMTGKFVILKNHDGTYQYKFTTRPLDDIRFRDYDD